jgi:hypothetical protein
MDKQLAWTIVGGLSKPGKMPWWSYSIPAEACKVGSRLAKAEGTVCHGCYALKGNYTFPNVQAAMERRLASLKDPRWVDAMVYLLSTLSRGKPRYFRWHDSGDLQSVTHLHKIVKVAKRTPNVQHWLPTKEKLLIMAYAHPFPSNLTIRLSAPRLDQQVSSKYPTSAVSSTGGVTCPAYSQGNRCGDCRKCWNASIPLVVYPKH